MSSVQSISHEIAATLRSEILRLRYRPGERLPSERELAARFGASRGAVREALSQLDQTGLISIQPGGARVKPLESATLAVLGPLLDLEELPPAHLVDQVLEMFGILMGLTVRRAIELASAEQMIHLQGLLAGLSQQSGDFADQEPAWREMLEYLTGISDNLVVRLIGNDLKAQFLGKMMKLGLKPRLRPAAGNELVRGLRQAFSRREGKLAADAFQKHFSILRTAVMQVLNEQAQSAMPTAMRSQANG